MKTTLYSLLAAAACGMALGQTAYTNPVGYVSLGDTTSGQPAVKASTDVTVAIPLARTTEYAGAISDATTSTIQVSGSPGWVASPAVGSWVPGAASPYIVTINSGSQNGFVGLITANTSDTLTVTPISGTAAQLDSVVAGATIQIQKAWTVSAFISPTSVPAGTRLLVYFGTTSGVNLVPNATHQTNGANWKIGPTTTDNTVLYPGESYVVRAGTTQIASLVVSGEVPLANSRTYIDKITANVGQDTRISFYGAGEEIIGNSGLVASLGIVNGDRLLAYNNNAAGVNKVPNETLQYNGTDWKIGPSTVTTTYTLKSGRGYILRRVTTAPVGPIDWSDKPSYLPFP